ncbi:MAG: Hsp20/alpha crystallin family protein [Myxococcota bacterium]|nr:Hsp20/alpha crystallin family protein [Myxococcales bacterium]
MAERESKSNVSVWDPFRDWSLFPRWSPLGESLFASERRAPSWAPAVDVSEGEKQYTVTVELPGARKEDVNVEVHEGVLTIRGEKRSEREEKDEHRRYVERSYGSFARSFSLPTNADAEAVHASFQEGVLTVEVPKRDEAKPRSVSVK